MIACIDSNENIYDSKLQRVIDRLDLKEASKLFISNPLPSHIREGN